MNIKRRLTSLPPETYLFFPLFGAGILIALFHRPAVEHTHQFVSYVIDALGSSTILYGHAFFLIFLVYATVKLFFVNKQQSFRELYTKIKKAFTSILFSLGGFIAATAAISPISYFLFTAVSKTEVIEASTLMMKADRVLFGSYIPFSIHSINIPSLIDVLIVTVYSTFSMVMIGAFLLLLLIDTVRFRKFTMMFIGAFLISIPVWLVIPAISPEEMYRLNIFSLPYSHLPDSQIISSISISDTLNAYLNTIAGLWSNPQQKLYAITSFPSMHVAWGAISAYLLTTAWRPFGIVMIPWFVLNALSTVYTLQHYAVDIVAGLFVAIIAIWGTNKIFEKYPHSQYHDYFYAPELIKSDVAKCAHFIYASVRDKIMTTQHGNTETGK